MIIIGERINGMFKDIGNALRNKDPKPLLLLLNKSIYADSYLKVFRTR